MSLLGLRVARIWLREKIARDVDQDKTRDVTVSDEESRNSDYQEFLQERYQGGQARIPNPNPDTREKWPEVSFETAMKDPAFQGHVSREFEQWRGQRSETPSGQSGQPEVETPAEGEPDDEGLSEILSRMFKPQPPVQDVWSTLEAQEKFLDIARDGEQIADDPVGRSSANPTRKRRFRLGDKEADYLWKPVEGSQALRFGIDKETYHAREAAVYEIDRLLGEGTIVPPTISTGDGSLQAWSDGAETLTRAGESLDDVSNDELKANKSFQRLVVLDAIVGHEDRSPSNVMFRWVGPRSDASNLRFDGIDNSCALANPREKQNEESYMVLDPWSYSVMDGDDEAAGMRAKAVSDVLSEIPEEMHRSMTNIDIPSFIKAMGTTVERDAARAAAVRLVALQEDPFVLGDLIREAQGNYRKGLQKFFYMSGRNPKELLRRARAEGRLQEIEDALSAHHREGSIRSFLRRLWNYG